MGKWCLHASSFIFDQIVIKVAGNQDRHKSSDEFDFGPLVSMAHLYVFWNEIWPWHIGLRWAIVALWATCFKPATSDQNDKTFQPPCDKTIKMTVRPAKTQMSLGIRPVWPESSLSAWRKLGSLATHWAHSEDSDQTGCMPRLTWVFAGCTATLLVLSWGGSYHTN